MVKFLTPSALFKAVLIALMLVSWGCSNRALYEGTQINRINDCQKLQGRAFEDCMAQHQMSYPEYERKREEVLEGDKDKD